MPYDEGCDNGVDAADPAIGALEDAGYCDCEITDADVAEAPPSDVELAVKIVIVPSVDVELLLPDSKDELKLVGEAALLPGTVDDIVLSDVMLCTADEDVTDNTDVELDMTELEKIEPDVIELESDMSELDRGGSVLPAVDVRDEVRP